MSNQSTEIEKVKGRERVKNFRQTQRDQGKRRLDTYLDDDLLSLVREYASQIDVPTSRAVEQLLQDGLKLKGMLKGSPGFWKEVRMRAERHRHRYR
jgi:hypothetical protein